MERDGRADLKSMTLPELTEYLKDLGEKPFRAKQLYQWMHVKLAASLDEMTNLSKEMRGILKEKAFYASLNPVDVRISQIDGTRKYLFELEDGNVTLMPVANSFALKDVLDACHYYFEKTGRRLTFEYSLVKGVNDNLDEARALADLLKGQHGHVNLIPVNPIKERDFKQSDRKAVEEFKQYLEKRGINVTVRREMGRDIDGACGQLRKSYIEKERT